MRAPLLERLLARGASTGAVEDWRAHAWRMLAPGTEFPGVACGARERSATAESEASARSALGAGWLMLASPVNLIAGMRGVSLAEDGLLPLSAQEADWLASEFNRAFSAGGARLVRGRGQRLLCLIEASSRGAPPPLTTDPATIIGRDILAHLPQGAAGASLRALMSETEIWLHDHPLNDARRARDEPAIGGLWLWGGARGDEPLPPLDLWSHGDDPLFGAYAPRERYPRDARSGIIVSATPPGEGSYAILERDWLVPALADLRAGRLERLELSLGSRTHRLGRLGSYRLWRRAHPWWMEPSSDEEPA